MQNHPDHLYRHGLTGLQAGDLPLRQSTRRPPLFVIQDNDSEESVVALVAERLDTDIPVFGLSVQAIESPRPQTVEGLAARLVQTIRGVQPLGPYRLAGWSQSGLVAYEVATQLVGHDEAVEFVGLVGEYLRCDRRSYSPQAAASLPVHLFVQPGTEGAGGPEHTVSWRHLLPATQLREVQLPPTGRGIGLPGPALWRALGEAIAACHGQVVQQAEFQYRPQLTIQSGSRGAEPLFCIPGAGDSVTGFTGLASALGGQWPVHGLQPRGVEGVMVPHASVQAAAQSYLRAIEDVQPAGPVHLVGHSFGGWVAFEVALRLQAARRPVASLTLVDSEAPGQGDVLGQEHRAVDVVSMLMESLELASEKRLNISRAMLEAADASERLAMTHAGAVRVGLMPARSRPDSLSGSVRTFAAALRTTYRPQFAYDGPVRLVLTPDLRLDAAGNQLQYQRMEEVWRSHAPHLSSWTGPGNHMTILKPPHVGVLAKWWLAGLHVAAAVSTHAAAEARDSVAAAL